MKRANCDSCIDCPSLNQQLASTLPYAGPASYMSIAVTTAVEIFASSRLQLHDILQLPHFALALQKQMYKHMLEMLLVAAGYSALQAARLERSSLALQALCLALWLPGLCWAHALAQMGGRSAIPTQHSCIIMTCTLSYTTTLTVQHAFYMRFSLVPR